MFHLLLQVDLSCNTQKSLKNMTCFTLSFL